MQDSARTFERFGLTGFRVGSTQFTADNPETMRGERIAASLEMMIAGTLLGREVRRARSMEQLIESLVKEIANGTALD